MLNTESFIRRLVDAGITTLISVPCSHAKDLINGFINNPDLEYIPAASESVALSIGAGITMAGGHALVFVQSSGLANMASGLTSLIQPYDIKFPIITSWRTYEPGDSEIQHAVLAENLPSFIESMGFPFTIIEKNDENLAIDAIIDSYTRQQILVLQAETFSKVALNAEHQNTRGGYTPRGEFLRALNEEYAGSNTLFIGTTGATSREMATLMPDTKNFYMAGNMGNALSLGVGAWLGGVEHVVVLGGDAESLMHLGGLVTAYQINQKKETGKLQYVIMDNQSNFTTGGQISPAKDFDLGSMVDGMGIGVMHEINDPDELVNELSISNDNFEVFIVQCGFDETYPRPSADQIINSVQAFK